MHLVAVTERVLVAVVIRRVTPSQVLVGIAQGVGVCSHLIPGTVTGGRISQKEREGNRIWVTPTFLNCSREQFGKMSHECVEGRSLQQQAARLLIARTRVARSVGG